MKQKLRLFGISFFCTLTAIALLCGFAVVDYNTRQSGFGEFSPLMEARQVSALQYDIELLGEQFTLRLEGANTAVYYARQAAMLLPPKSRLTLKLAALGMEALEALFLL